MKVVHLLYKLSNIMTIHRFKRTILSFDNTEQLQYYVLVPRNVQKINLKNGNHNIIYYNGDRDIITQVNKIDPCAIIVSMRADYVHNIYSRFRCQKIYFIHHGIVSATNLDVGKFRWSKRINYIVGCKRLYNVLYKYMGSSNKIFKINGLPQLDLILNQQKVMSTKERTLALKKKHSLDPNVKTILLVTGGGNYCFRDISARKIINVLNNTNIKYKLFIKNKAESYNKHFRNIKSSTMLKDTDSFYEYIYCDYIIVEMGSTALLEGLMINKNVILYQVDNQNKVNHMTEKYGLMVAETINEFKKYINMIVNNDPYLDSTIYKHGINRYTHDSIGSLEIVSDKIMNIVTK